MSLLLSAFACSGADGSKLHYRTVVLSEDQSALATRLGIDDRPAIILSGAGGSGGTILVVVSPELCQEVNSVERKDRTLVVVLSRPPLRENEFCRADKHVIGLEVDVATPIDEVSTVSR